MQFPEMPLGATAVMLLSRGPFAPGLAECTSIVAGKFLSGIDPDCALQDLLESITPAEDSYCGQAPA
jgi:hypothetical protein